MLNSTCTRLRGGFLLQVHPEQSAGMQTDGPTLPVRGYAQLPGVWAARDVTQSSPTQSSSADRRAARRRRTRAGGRAGAPFEVDGREGLKRLPPMRSPQQSRRTSSLLQSFGRSPSPVKRSPLPMAYSQETAANPMASFSSSVGEDTVTEDSPARPAEGGGLAAADATDSGWKTQYGLFDLTAAGGAIVDVLSEVQGRLKEAWLMGPSMPVLRTAPLLKVLNAEHLEMLKKACVETQPIELQLEQFRVRHVRHAHAGMLELDAVFSSPALLLMKEHWLSMLGDAVDDLEIRLYDRSLSSVHVPLGRVGAEWSSQMAEFTQTLHEEFLLPLTFSVSAMHVLEDVSAGSCSVLQLHGKAAQWEKDKRRPGWMSLLISDALTELDGKPPMEHTFQSLRAGSAMSVSGILDEDGRPLSVMEESINSIDLCAVAGAEQPEDASTAHADTGAVAAEADEVEDDSGHDDAAEGEADAEAAGAEAASEGAGESG